ncbi:hypothetical protein ACFYRC_04120 [Streptomyces sp. NPDC005279]|uniref:hypothetical protein n=1 Tax=Streptomyces sp. NPDC005279 TaxID=3364712 RepID=UPI0036A65BF1
MRRRIVVAIAASVGITALAATGVNYASASSSVPKSAPSIQDADSSVPLGGDVGQTNFGVEGQANGPTNGQNNHNYRNDDDGRIQVNERTYSVDTGVCTAVISSPAMSFNVRSESDRTVEFFRGITCDNGAPIAIIEPRGSSSGVEGTTVLDGAVVPFALVGSFRAIDKRH